MVALLICTGLSYIASGMAILALFSSVYVAYSSMKHRVIIDEAETQIMGMLDDVFELLLPTGILPHIGTGEVANLEINRDFAVSCEKVNVKQKNRDAIAYPCDISKQFSEKSQMYEDFGATQKNYVDLPETNEMISLAMTKSRDPTKQKRNEFEKPSLTPARTPATPAPTATPVRTPAAAVAQSKGNAGIKKKTSPKAEPKKSKESLKGTQQNPPSVDTTVVPPKLSTSKELLKRKAMQPHVTASNATIDRKSKENIGSFERIEKNTQRTRKSDQETLPTQGGESQKSKTGSKQKKKGNEVQKTMPDEVPSDS